MKTESSYNKRMNELRKLRDDNRKKANEYEQLARKYADEMDKLEGNTKIINLIKGSYIKLVSSNSDTVRYFNVVSWKDDTRGVRLTGAGFCLSNSGNRCYINIESDLRVTWDEVENNNIKPIDEGEYFAAFENALLIVKKKLLFPNKLSDTDASGFGFTTEELKKLSAVNVSEWVSKLHNIRGTERSLKVKTKI